MPIPQRPTMLVLTAAAGLVHLAQVVPHARQAWLAGAAFLLLGLAQLGVVAAAWAAPRRTRAALVAVNAVAAASWVASRTVGLPLGLGHDTADVVAVLTVAVEALAIVVGLAPDGAPRRHPVLATSLALLLLPLGAVAAGPSEAHVHADTSEAKTEAGTEAAAEAEAEAPSPAPGAGRHGSEPAAGEHGDAATEPDHGHAVDGPEHAHDGEA